MIFVIWNNKRRLEKRKKKKDKDERRLKQYKKEFTES